MYFYIFIVLGYVIPQLIPKRWTILLSMILFLFFGLKMLWEAYKDEQVFKKIKHIYILRKINLTYSIQKKKKMRLKCIYRL